LPELWTETQKGPFFDSQCTYTGWHKKVEHACFM